MRKPSEVIARAIQLEAYKPEFVGHSSFDFRKYQPFLCNVIKWFGEFDKTECYSTIRAIGTKLGQHETLFSFWVHNVRARGGESFSADWAMQFWQEFIAELQSQGR